MTKFSNALLGLGNEPNLGEKMCRNAKAIRLPLVLSAVLAAPFYAQSSSRGPVSNGYLIAATGSDSYNTPVCTDFGSHFGRQHVFQIGRRKAQGADPREVAVTLGGRTLPKSGSDLSALVQRQSENCRFRKQR